MKSCNRDIRTKLLIMHSLAVADCKNISKLYGRCFFVRLSVILRLKKISIMARKRLFRFFSYLNVVGYKYTITMDTQYINKIRIGEIN